MNAQIQMNTRLHKPWSVVARVGWVAVVLLIMVFFGIGLVNGLGQLRTVCTGGDCHPAQLDPQLTEFNLQLGLSLDFYAWFTTIVFAVFGFFFFAMAWLIFLQRPDDWMALFVSIWMVMLSAGVNPVIPTLGPVLRRLSTLGFFPLLCLFPDGRFVPRWMRWLVLVWILYESYNLFSSPPSAGGISSGRPPPILQVSLLAGIGAQVYRYWRVSTPLQRQQTKWVVFGFTAVFASLVLLLLAFAFYPELNDPGLPNFVMQRYAFAFVGLLPILFIPTGLAISILRYRLWDIDLIIRRTLVYGAFTTILVVLYAGLVIVLGGVLRTLVGGGGQLATVISTLAIIVLFNPLRHRVQDAIDRRFYRQKYDAERALVQFAAAARSETDMDALSAQVVDIVQETMQPESLSLWLKEK